MVSANPSQGATYTGGCTCGAVRYQLGAKPLVVHCCHCTWCQRETGSAFAVNALIERDRLLLEGDVNVVNTPSQSGKGQRIARCPTCEVALFSHYRFGSIGDLVCFVRVGTLDEPALLPPDVHIFTASKQPWVALPGDTPAVEQYYKASEVWRPDSLERRAALFAAVAPAPASGG